MKPPRTLPRRDFIASSARAGLGAMIVPRHVLGGPGYRAPSDRLNVAIIGAGGMGLSNAEELLDENIVALCDVDFGYVERRVEARLTDGSGEPRPAGIRVAEAYRRAARYADFRQMLEREPGIDAVVIATPDHQHAVQAEMAMRLGKHVYVQKPLAATVAECRKLAGTAAETGVVTQMGNQGQSSLEARLIHDWVRAGVIGAVHDVHVWTNRPIWPQGVPRPELWRPDRAAPEPVTGTWNSGVIRGMTQRAMTGEYPAPPDLDWELYTAPVPRVPYHPVYHPFNWRGWVDFGVGALGDMGAHLLDHSYRALELGYPETVEATSTPWGQPGADPATFPQAMKVHYRFPAAGGRGPVRLHWTDGGLMPARPEGLPHDVTLSRTGGALLVGERGILLHETYGRNPRLFPEGLMEGVERMPEDFERDDGEHERNWAAACRGEAEATSPFSWAAPLTEVMLLGIVALRAGQGRTIEYDADAMRVTNVEDANAALTREYRSGWEL